MLKQNLKRQDLRDVFTIVADRKGVLPLVVEKDFWITWCLQNLFLLPLPVTMVFKGGTSLSKGYKLINRLSEDCDITLNRADLGFVGERDPLNASSRKKRDKLLDELKTVCNDFVSSTLKTRLYESLKQELEGETWNLSVDEDPQSLRFYYPQVLSENNYAAQDYIRKSVLLEFGVRGDIYPTEGRRLTSYIAEEFETFDDSSLLIPCLSPLRTFWEKATLLHAEHHRPIEKPTPLRISRHYYDLSMLYKAGFAENAMKNSEILQDVIKNKTLLFPSAWANYGLIWTDSLKLLPTAGRLSDLEKDYAQTKEMMLFGVKPSFEDILGDIATLEKKLKKLGTFPPREGLL
ncbi:MAG: nucleotidyl transferase AbiEii/AbiGii toxin family protein [Alphaproteobacteria bacterium]|nr:nucleotidyl transferase AbiEii/AbiGii toxin family protein [Alphaproteobacteria bacterium]